MSLSLHYERSHSWLQYRTVKTALPSLVVGGGKGEGGKERETVTREISLIFLPVLFYSCSDNSCPHWRSKCDHYARTLYRPDLQLCCPTLSWAVGKFCWHMASDVNHTPSTGLLQPHKQACLSYLTRKTETKWQMKLSQSALQQNKLGNLWTT